jgi:alpha-L-fucosidase
MTSRSHLERRGGAPTDPLVERAVQVRPSARQLAWQRMEFYAFVHFGMNTFTDREWGTGAEDPKLFHPTELDARQWVEACKAARMTGLILTCKHHDGFCLWPTERTDHSVRSSAWRGGRGDVVREVAAACREGGLRFGVYLSPWDRHEPCYGDSPAYDRFFVGQLEELLTGYGPVFCVWFDGACGEGPNGKRQSHDWERYYATVRRLQPDAVISVCGPDTRWCGNEAGHCRQDEWSVVPALLRDVEKIEEKSQKVDDGAFSRRVTSADEDLGSREAIRHAGPLVWYPAEVNTSIRPGWFYHGAEDAKVRSVHELLEIYFQSVGGNATFLLNIPPDRRGRFHENDVARLTELGAALRAELGGDLATSATLTATESLDAAHRPEHALSRDPDRFWRPRDGTARAALTLRFDGAEVVDKVLLMEHIASSQRIESFELAHEAAGGWATFFSGGIVGYQRICRFEPLTVRALRISVTASRGFPTLARIGVFRGRAVAVR